MDGHFVGVIDFTTDELADELVGGFHVGGPERLRRIGRLGLPQVVVPGCIDFTVHGRPEEVPARLAGPARLHAQPGVHARPHAAGRDGPARARVRRAPERRDRTARDHGAHRRPVDPQRAWRRVLEPGGRRRVPRVRCASTFARGSRCRRIPNTSMRRNSPWQWPSGSSCSSSRKEPPHDRPRARQAAVEQHGRSGLSGHPGLPEGLRHGARADGQHRAARPAPAAVHRHGHRDRGRLARRQDQQHAAHAGASGPATRRSTWPAPAKAAAPSPSARRRCRR